MQVREHHRVDRRGIETCLAQRDERCGAAIDEGPAAGTLDEQAGLEAPAATECVARAEDVDSQVWEGVSQARGSVGGCQAANRSSSSAGLSAKSSSEK